MDKINTGHLSEKQKKFFNHYAKNELANTYYDMNRKARKELCEILDFSEERRNIFIISFLVGLCFGAIIGLLTLFFIIF